MARKNNQTQSEETIQKKRTGNLRLLQGVNFTALGEKEETRIEAGLIEEGVLPPAFEARLKERKILVPA